MDVTSNNAITVYTNGGDITLDNINVSQQGGEDYTAYLNSNSGDITVEDSSFDGNNSGNNENRGFRAANQYRVNISYRHIFFRRTMVVPDSLWWCIDALKIMMVQP